MRLLNIPLVTVAHKDWYYYQYHSCNHQLPAFEGHREAWHVPSEPTLCQISHLGQINQAFDSPDLASVGELGTYLRQQCQLKPRQKKKKKQFRNLPLTKVFHSSRLRSLQDTLYGIEAYEEDLIRKHRYPDTQKSTLPLSRSSTGGPKERRIK